MSMNEEGLRLDFERCSRIFGDETALYRVSTNKECTLGELVNAVLTRRHEWGYLYVKGVAGFEYRYGDIVGVQKFSKELLARKVLRIKGSGGWSRMDYIIELE